MITRRFVRARPSMKKSSSVLLAILLGLASALFFTMTYVQLFALLLGVLFLGEPWPSAFSFVGAGLIVVGMVLYSRVSVASELEPAAVQT